MGIGIAQDAKAFLWRSREEKKASESAGLVFFLVRW